MLNEQKDGWVKLSCLQLCIKCVPRVLGFSCLSKEFVVDFCFEQSIKSRRRRTASQGQGTMNGFLWATGSRLIVLAGDHIRNGQRCLNED